MKAYRALPLALLFPLLAACVVSPVEEVAASTLTYSCCETADVERSYQPGQTFTLNWVVESPDEPPVTPTPGPGVELTAHLIGPFESVEQLTAHAMGTLTVPGLVTYPAEPVRPADAPDRRPVSTIVIAPDAGPGYYNLISSMADQGNAVGGESVIQVVPAD
ncbi:hypothetical protein ACIBO1_30350 [Micromonospora sp. NPDC049903]|uniref:hypothetical protein n=1 Tax=Micromonospora sp. NPDC049903 TaxID=3364276 RepID=UPI0037A87C38